MTFYNSTSDIVVLEADRKPCIVCGHPTGDCVGDSHWQGAAHFVRPVKDPAATFTVPVRVYLEKLSGQRWVKTLLYAVGTRITPTEARRVGIIVDDDEVVGEDIVFRE